jgi:hypothetical protein
MPVMAACSVSSRSADGDGYPTKDSLFDGVFKQPLIGISLPFWQTNAGCNSFGIEIVRNQGQLECYDLPARYRVMG